MQKHEESKKLIIFIYVLIYLRIYLFVYLFIYLFNCLFLHDNGFISRSFWFYLILDFIIRSL